MAHDVKNVVFDLGGVLIDWNPRYLYKKVFFSPQAMEHFLTNVCNQEWNEKQDAGCSFAEGITELVAKFSCLSGCGTILAFGQFFATLDLISLRAGYYDSQAFI